MTEEWVIIEHFPDYAVSSFGNIRSEKSGRILLTSPNQYGVVQVGLMRAGTQFHRSVPLLVARAFLPPVNAAFDTPINLDGDRHNNRLDNLVWRPRWFAIEYNRQVKHPYWDPINRPIVDLNTKEVSPNSTECAMRYGLLEEDLILAILNRTYVWPTYQEFDVYKK